MTDTMKAVVPLNIDPVALRLALACRSGEEHRPKLTGVRLDPEGFVVGTDGFRVSVYRDGWELFPGVRNGGHIIRGDLKGLARVAREADKQRGRVLLMPEDGGGWSAEAFITSRRRKVVAPAPVTVEADAPGEDWVPWRQLIPWSGKLAPCTVALNPELLAGLTKHLPGNRGVRLYTTAEERGILLRAAGLPRWVGVLSPMRAASFERWTQDDYATFFGQPVAEVVAEERAA